MKTPFALLAIVLLSAGEGCAGTGKNAGPASRVPSNTVASSSSVPATNAPSTTPAQAPVKLDHDDDDDNPNNSFFDKDDDVYALYGHAASRADRRAVTAVVKRYYAAAAAGDGARGCALIYSLFAENIAETYGRPPAGSASALRGNTCAAVMSGLFRQRHQQLATDNAALEVVGVRVEGRRGWALLRFGTRSPHRFLVHDERGIWRMDELLDSGMP